MVIYWSVGSVWGCFGCEKHTLVLVSGYVRFGSTVVTLDCICSVVNCCSDYGGVTSYACNNVHVTYPMEHLEYNSSV